MTHREAITQAMGNVQWARRHLIPIRKEGGEVVDDAIETLRTCIEEMQDALRPSPLQGSEQLIRALPTTLSRVAGRLNSVDAEASQEARQELFDAISHREAEEIRWAPIK